jgi:hypothetical protein
VADHSIAELSAAVLIAAFFESGTDGPLAEYLLVEGWRSQNPVSGEQEQCGGGDARSECRAASDRLPFGY